LLKQWYNRVMITLETKCGQITGLTNDNCNAFLGIRYATAGRFEYATPVKSWQGCYDATSFGDACIQKRTWYQHLEVPERCFYYNEFRRGLDFNYSEDCLNLNIYTPLKPGKYPVLVFIHGGGFDSGANSENPFDGQYFAQRDIVTVFINYRVGIFGYITHKEIQDKYGRNGNFGLDDQLTALKWIKENISDYWGDNTNITIMGQSAGAISIQYLCLNQDNKGLFDKAIMMSGGGKFPDFALPRLAKDNQEYWTSFMKKGNFTSFQELKSCDARRIFDTLEEYKPTRKDNTYSTMPCVDGYHLKDKVQKLIKKPLQISYIVGYTNNDMYAPILAYIGHKFVKHNNKKHNCFMYYFDQDAKGDNNKAFHSSDLNFMFNGFDKTWRPYTNEDKKLASLMQDYIADYVKYGTPNSQDNSRPKWKSSGTKTLRFNSDKKIKMTKPKYLTLLHNWLKVGEPK